jgi:hypothetical protein
MHVFNLVARHFIKVAKYRIRISGLQVHIQIMRLPDFILEI